MYEPTPINAQTNPDMSGQVARSRWSWATQWQDALQSGHDIDRSIAADPWLWVLVVIVIWVIIDLLPSRKKGKK